MISLFDFKAYLSELEENRDRYIIAVHPSHYEQIKELVADDYRIKEVNPTTMILPGKIYIYDNVQANRNFNLEIRNKNEQV